VAHHYDLGEALYRLFLDADWQYSCAYFEQPDRSLDEAQLAKKRHIAAKLLVEPGVTVLDIGCGWGGLALYLAAVGGAGRVKGITLSADQLACARRRAAELELGARVSFEIEDYRAVRGSFDRIASVGMFEHVGLARYRTFFGCVQRLLTPDGVMLLHTIGRTGEPAETNPWITRYIFPGGHLPTLSEIIPPVERSGLVLCDVEVLRLHYAETLRAWRERFLAHRAEALALYDERFCRMWECYLTMAEAAFRFEDVVVFQLQLARRNDVVPLTRDYIARREAALRRAERAVAGRTGAARE
jgi:cyclopropane-fatty-acyl-phospholipid synthase